MSKKATEFQKKEMSKMYRGKEIFKPLNTGWIDENVACVREWVANIFFYRKGDTAIMIDAGYNYDRLAEKMGWLGIDPASIRHILITPNGSNSDTDLGLQAVYQGSHICVHILLGLLLPGHHLPGGVAGGDEVHDVVAVGGLHDAGVAGLTGSIEAPVVEGLDHLAPADVLPFSEGSLAL